MQQSTLHHLLGQFRQLETSHGTDVPWTLRYDFGGHTKHIVFASIIHGNETGSLPALIHLARELSSQPHAYKGRVTFILGNVEAAIQNKRFLEADLNRVFGKESPPSLERTRAQELMPLLRDADLFIDFHQTILDSHQPFYIFPFHEPLYQWARLLGGADILVTRAPGQSFSRDKVCADEYVRQNGHIGFTIEMGRMGLTDIAYDTTTKVIRRALDALQQSSDALDVGSLIKPNEHPELQCFETSFRQKFAHPAMSLRDGLINFERVKKGEHLGLADDTNRALLAATDGFLLFPKYPLRDTQGHAQEPRPIDIYHLLSPITTHPREAYRISNDEP
jgi:succinylglutamate desuccinylase